MVTSMAVNARLIACAAYAHHPVSRLPTRCPWVPPCCVPRPHLLVLAAHHEGALDGPQHRVAHWEEADEGEAQHRANAHHHHHNGANQYRHHRARRQTRQRQSAHDARPSATSTAAGTRRVHHNTALATPSSAGERAHSGAPSGQGGVVAAHTRTSRQQRTACHAHWGAARMGQCTARTRGYVAT